MSTNTVKDLGVEEARVLQFPSLADQEGTEIAERSADETKASSTTWRKDFVLLGREWKIADKKAVHAANRLAVRQFLINQGLRTVPDEEIKVEESKHPDKVSVVLTYTVVAQAAAKADEPNVEHTRVDGEDPFEADPAFDENEGTEADELDPENPKDSGTPAF